MVKEIYKCDLCGNVLEVLVAGGGKIYCCGQPTKLLEPKTEDTGNEKHKPIFEVTPAGIVVKVGSIAHPMEEQHFIQWIEIRTIDGKIERKYLNPGQSPEAFFNVKKDDILEIVEYCNLHGLWVNQI